MAAFQSEVKGKRTHLASYTNVGSSQLCTSLVTVNTLTVPQGVDRVLIQAQSGPIRWRDDGGAPSATVGFYLESTDSVLYGGEIEKIRMIQVGTTAQVFASYYWGTSTP
jgi:hypothetical protein